MITEPLTRPIYHQSRRESLVGIR